jgi:Ni,Fe-hydrogenase III small subunit
MTQRFELAVVDRSDLVLTAAYTLHPDGSHAALQSTTSGAGAEESGKRIAAAIHNVLGRSLSIRQVDAGSCNGCEQEIVALNNPVHDIERFGIHFVSSPRHADMLLVTGPVTRNMELALRKTWAATPDPKVVVAVGACGISGGIFGTNYASLGGVDAVIPVDIYIPGCPPRPEALLYGILLALGQVRQRMSSHPHR